MKRFSSYWKFPDKPSLYIWWTLLLTVGLVSLVLRFYFLSNPLVEPHPWRQSQTALTIYYLVHGGIDWLAYESPLEGKLWKHVYEFPFYQWSVAIWMKLSGLTLEVSSRLVTLGYFFLSLFFFTKLVDFLLGRQCAIWACLFYFISPFNVVFSRVCLPDMMTLAFLLGYLWAFLAVPHQTGKARVRLFVVGFVCGLLAAVTKVQMWYVPTLFLFLYFCFPFLKYKEQRVCYGILLFSMLVHLALAMGWTQWTAAIRHETGKLDQMNNWFFGQFFHRLEWDRWLIILKSIFRVILHDWMGFLFIVGALFYRYRTIVGIGVLLIVLPIAVLFNIYQKHDYYLIGQMPFLIVIAAMGWLVIWRSKYYWKFSSLLIVAIILGYKLFKLPFMYTPIFEDYSSSDNLKVARKLKSLTAKSDVIYLHESEGKLEIPLYSERLVATWRWTPVKKIQPTLYKFPPGKEQLDLLSGYDRIWIESKGYQFLAYRVKNQGKFYYDLQSHLAVHREPPIEVDTSWTGGVIDSCDGAKLVKVPKNVSSISVHALDTSKSIRLPVSGFISFPRSSSLGCRFRVATR